MLPTLKKTTSGASAFPQVEQDDPSAGRAEPQYAQNISGPLLGVAPPLLKFGGGSIDDYAIWLLLGDAEAELLIASTECGDEHRHVSLPLRSTEALDGLQDAGRDPAQHLPPAPPLDFALHVTDATEKTLSGVGRGQGSAQTGREVQREDGERLVEPFAHALGRAGRRAGTKESKPATVQTLHRCVLRG